MPNSKRLSQNSSNTLEIDKLQLDGDASLIEKWKITLLLTYTSLATTAWLSSTFNLLSQNAISILEMSAAVLSFCFIAYSAASSLLEGVFGIDVLATVAIVASIIIGEYLAATVVALMLGGGEILEDYASQKASKAIQKLIEASPQTATVIRNGQEIETKIEDVKLGEAVIVKPGGKIPVDGTINKGKASVNQSSVTGESMPVERAVGDKVYGGTMIELGAIEISVTAVGEQSTYGRIITMVQEAEKRRAPIERTADKYAKYFTPAILALGIIVFLFTMDIHRVAALFVIACPCALTLATPTSIVASIGNAARKGILIRNGESLEKLSTVDTLVLDKTGTVTTGKPEVTDVKSFGKNSPQEVLRLAATAEKCSEHPLAQAILAKAEKEQLDPEEPQCFEVHPGLGVRIENGDPITVGNEKMLRKYSISLSNEAMAYLTEKQTTQTVIFVAKNDAIIGSLSISDTLRDDMKNVMIEAKASGVRRTIMLSGDNAQVAKAVAERIGADEVFSDMMPADKVEHIRKLREEGHIVAMVGDGINDAPALAAADVGIAMGLSGTDVAIETAGITLATDDLKRLPKLLRIGRQTVKIIKQNIAFAFMVNVLGITLAIGGIIPPLVASMIHESNALIVMLNSLRLLRVN